MQANRTLISWPSWFFSRTVSPSVMDTIVAGMPGVVDTSTQFPAIRIRPMMIVPSGFIRDVRESCELGNDRSQKAECVFGFQARQLLCIMHIHHCWGEFN
ncbi:hypothetical protein [Vulcanococcus limneticus]|uniref:hypothetical protein n=1 Tax=Vulcanococcus limneticus TaxID=2170428 RepID=UPI00398BD484